MMFKSQIKGSVFGVIAYIAKFYGITSAHDLLKRLDIKAPNYISGFDNTHLHDVLAHVLVIRDMRIYLPDFNLKTFEHKKDRIELFQRSKSIKICKQCLKEDGLHQNDWQLVYVTYCDKHNTSLIDSCNHIYVNESWHDKLKCKKCVTEIQSSSAPLFHLHHNQLLLSAPQNACYFLICLFKLAERLFRPFDFINSKVSWQTLSSPVLVELLEDAFVLGASEHTYKVWESEIRKHRAIIAPLGDFSINFGLTNIKNIIKSCNWKITHQTNINVHQILRKYHHRLNASHQINRAHILHRPNQDVVSFTITSQILARLIDVDVRGLKELHETNVLTALKGNVRMERMSWDIRIISDEIKLIFKHNVNYLSDTVSLGNADPKIIDTLLITHRQATLSLLRSELKGYILVNSTGFLITRTILSQASVLSMFQKELACLEHLSKHKTSRLLGVKIAFIDLLIDDGFLKYAHWQRHTAYLIDKTCIQDFFKVYVSINREALLEGVDLKEYTQKVINCCGIQPTIVKKVILNNTPFILYKIDEMNKCCYQKAVSTLDAIRVKEIDVSNRVERFANYN